MKAIGRTQSLVIAAVLIVAVFAGGWFGLVKPTKTSVNNVKTQAQSQESTNSTLQLQLSVLKALAKKLPQQQAELALSIASRGYVLATGEIVLQGAAQELLDNPQIQEAYLGKASPG